MRKHSVIATLLLALVPTLASAQGVVIYNSTPTPVPPNVPSLGYQATSTAEFGDHIVFGGVDRRADAVTLTMSDWALHSDYPSMPAAGFNHPITLNLYAVDHTGPQPALGALLSSATRTFVIPWRPEADPTCPGGTAWRAPDTACYNGLAFNITFVLRSLNLTLPNEVIFGVAYNTQTWGYAPLLLAGPYNSLNVGLNPAAGTPSVGTNPDPDDTFYNTSFAGFYTDGGAGGVGIFRRDTGWAGLIPAARFTAFTVASSVNACKTGGWQTLRRADGSAFKNQGDCVSYTNTGR